MAVIKNNPTGWPNRGGSKRFEEGLLREGERQVDLGRGVAEGGSSSFGWLISGREGDEKPPSHVAVCNRTAARHV